MFVCPVIMVRLIALEGNIGAGKSTVLNIVKEILPSSYAFLEPVDKWENVDFVDKIGHFNPIQLFYEVKIDISLFQNFILSSYSRELNIFLKSVPENALVFTERSLNSSINIFARAALHSGLITE